MSGWRLPEGGLIDRARPLTFRWSGRELQGFSGDTLASALLANGVSIVGRSFKYHRPRGLLAAGLEEPNAICQLESGATTIPNVKATQVELYEGLVARPVNVRPSAERDLMAVNGWFKRFIPAAFYYKTFIWPSWKLFEPAIRRAAGLGVAPEAPDPDRYGHRFAHCDTLVVGSGAAGLAAARAAAEAGERVTFVELEPELGGGLLWAAEPVEGRPAAAWRAEALAALHGRPNVTLLPRTMAFGYYDHDLVGLVERLSDHLPPDRRRGPRQRLWKVRAKRVVLATGAIERPLAFAGNDLPGVMLASAAATYLGRFGVAPGRRVVVATNNDSARAVVAALIKAGVEVAAVLDSRAEAPTIASGVRVLAGAAPIRATGRGAVKAMIAGDMATGGGRETIACDALLVSGGWSPAVHLHSQAGGSLAFDPALRAFVPNATPQNAISVGAAAGLFDMDAAIASGRTAGGQATARPAATPIGPVLEFADGDPQAHKAWLDFQNDVTVGDVQLAVRENFRSVEHVKRYTTLGMASDQGKTSNVPGIAVLSGLLGKAPPEIGTTKFRPPYDPVMIGAFAGRAVGDDLMPGSLLAAHDRHVALGGRMEDYGGWKRAAFYARDGEDEHRAVAREVLAVRGSVGLFEASPLGKIELKGPDAAEFLERIYVNQVKTLKPGRLRYGLMLNENGVVYDDGVFARLACDHFLVGTTSGHAAAIADMLEEWLQCEWPHLKVVTQDVTTAWAVVNVAGPKARQVLAALSPDCSLAAADFPHMTCRSGTIAGARCRVQRVSFTGELSYEVSVAWRAGAALWDAMMRAGAPFGVTPFGVEALMMMRVEKGFLHVGSDTDGTTLPQDVGFGPIVAKKASDFMGRRSTMRPGALRDDRRQLVGLEVADGGGPLAVGAHILPTGSREPRGTAGWVTSAVQSPTLGRPLALALVERGTSRRGQEVSVWNLGETRRARIADPRFYDPGGERLND